MKFTRSLFCFLLALVVATGASAAPAGNATTTAPSVQDQADAIAAKIEAKIDLAKGKITELDVAPELKQWDDLFAAHKAEKSDAVAAILLLKATLYAEMFDNPGQGIVYLHQVKTDFPLTLAAKEVDEKEAEMLTIKMELGAGKGAKESSFADDLKTFDTLSAAHKDAPEQAAKILVLKAMAYARIFGDVTNGIATLQQIRKDYPKTDAAQAADNFEVDMRLARIELGLDQGAASATFAADFKQIDALAAAHKDTPDDAAIIIMQKVKFLVTVAEDPDAAIAAVKQMKSDYPKSKYSDQADRIIAEIQDGADAAKARRGLVVGAKFPDFDVKDLDGKPLSIAGVLAEPKARFVLVDFWATWCVPCVEELPNVEAAYKKYHDQGFQIIGISLDRDKKQVLTDFLAQEKANGMTWAQFYDGKYYETELAVKYGVESIPTSYLLDSDGKIIAKNPRGGQLDAALAKAFAAKPATPAGK